MSLSSQRSIKTTILLGTIAVLLLTPSIARGHADYERSDPPAGAVIPTAPEEVHIWFTQELFRREGENDIRVIGPGDEEVHLGGAIIDDDDRAHMWVALQPGLGEGEYRVLWRSLSADDGDTEEGEFTFSVDASAPEPTPLPPAATEEDSPTSSAPTVQPVSTADDTPTGGLECFGSTMLGLGVIALGLWRKRR